ncbi:MAG: 50S ribosomal protein L11 methyltransferase [Ferruginibacter sp.]
MQQEEDLKKCIDAFEKKLELVIIDDISAALYCKKYLAHLLQYKKYYLAIYADVLNKLIRQSTQKKENILLIDFGAGNGLLGIFAKYCGFKKVFVNDIDEKFVQASRKLAAQLHVEIDGYITGDIITVQSYFADEIPAAIVGTDVIEHIYDLGVFYKTIRQINPLMISVFTTASNPANYFKVRALQKIQLKDELEGGSPDDHALFGESPLQPFLKMREEIIGKYARNMTDVEILALAKATRGMVQEDIRSSVETYMASGKMPVPASDTNTCNPLNGSWTERILSLDTYISLYADAGFTCKFYAGFYNDYEQGLMNFVKKLLNAGITTLGKKISPYIVLVGTKK